jgi:hypothetical protein
MPAKQRRFAARVVPYCEAASNFDPRFGAKRLKQYRDWRTLENVSRINRDPFFSRQFIYHKHLGLYRQSKSGTDFTHRGVYCAENMDLGWLVLELWSHDSGARAGAPHEPS